LLIEYPIRNSEARNVLTCFECGDGTLTPNRVQLEGSRHGETFTVETDGLKCDQCGFETIDNEQSAEFTQLVSDAYRKAHGLLTGEEIHSRRTQLGMTQQRFSEYLGTGVASVKRWEAGQIQDRAMDQLIRLKTDPEAARKNLKTVEQHVPEQIVVSEGEEVTLFFMMGEHSQYVHPHAMTVETFSIVHRSDLTIADGSIAA
jgi:putative zinc finger/helix-turn-helix YgiT family protein